MTSKYEAIHWFLNARDGSRTRLSFSKIEDIIGKKLPKTAHSSATWWESRHDDSRAHIRAWEEAGWSVSTVNLDKKTVSFTRFGESDSATGDASPWCKMGGAASGLAMSSPLLVGALGKFLVPAVALTVAYRALQEHDLHIRFVVITFLLLLAYFGGGFIHGMVDSSLAVLYAGEDQKIIRAQGIAFVAQNAFFILIVLLYFIWVFYIALFKIVDRRVPFAAYFDRFKKPATEKQPVQKKMPKAASKPTATSRPKKPTPKRPQSVARSRIEGGGKMGMAAAMSTAFITAVEFFTSNNSRS